MTIDWITGFAIVSIFAFCAIFYIFYLIVECLRSHKEGLEQIIFAVEYIANKKGIKL